MENHEFDVKFPANSEISYKTENGNFREMIKSHFWDASTFKKCKLIFFYSGQNWNNQLIKFSISASSVVSSHGPSAAAKEHEKRILENILPPDLRHLIRGGTSTYSSIQVGR